MVPITKAQQDRLAKVARRHVKPLMKKAGVADVGIGYRYRNGKPTGELAIVVRVPKKIPLARLARKDRVPRTVSGVATDVVEGVPVPLAGPHDRHDPIVGGISIGCPGGSGTLGCIVFGRHTGRPFGLTNHHVLVPDAPQPPKPWLVAQPADEGAYRLIGEHVRDDVATDSALFSLDLGSAGPRGLDTGILHAVSAPSRGTRVPMVGMPVQKAGATTGLTYGIVTVISYATHNLYIDHDDATGAPAVELAGPGDSGSVVTDRVGAVVGLLNQSFNRGGIAIAIDAVTRALDCFVFDRDQGVWTPPKAWIGSGHLAFTIVAPHEHATLSVRYPSGRISTAQGLGRKRADANGIITWQWIVGTSTQRRPNVNCEVRLKVADRTHRAWFGLEGTTRYDR
jgi:hypothetical protein